MTFNQYTFTCIDIHTLSIIDIDNLERTQSFDFDDLIFLQIHLDDIKHRTYKDNSISFIQSITYDKYLR